MKSTRAPKRFQMRRTKGWRKPKDGIYVGRPTKWGNPFPLDDNTSREEMVRRFESYLKKMPEKKREVLLEPLRGKDLGCWCPLDVPCHADIWLKWAAKRE